MFYVNIWTYEYTDITLGFFFDLNARLNCFKFEEIIIF